MQNLLTIADWLDWIRSRTQEPIQLGLDRVKQVLAELGINPFTAKVIVVAGTNGKGSTVRALEAIYTEAGYCTGVFTSPALFAFNEQIRLSGKEATDETIVQAFRCVASSASSHALTPFEWVTVAAFCIFAEALCDVLILEIGLGGRLDAVNVLDNDVAIITSISLDHTEWLGTTREAIAFEKCGIFRRGKPAIISDLDIPETVYRLADEQEVKLYRLQHEFSYDLARHRFQAGDTLIDALPVPRLYPNNLACALMAATLLQADLPLSHDEIRKALDGLTLAGREQHVTIDAIEHCFDVAHNPASIQLLKDHLMSLNLGKRVLAVFSMLSDKDIETSVKTICSEVDEWWVAEVQDARAATLQSLCDALQAACVHKEALHTASSIGEAYSAVRGKARPGDLILVFGSFRTVAEAWAVSKG